MCTFFPVSFSCFAVRMQQAAFSVPRFLFEKTKQKKKKKKNKRFFTYVSFLPRLAILIKQKIKN
jgi:hypothetical protein